MPSYRTVITFALMTVGSVEGLAMNAYALYVSLGTTHTDGISQTTWGHALGLPVTLWASMVYMILFAVLAGVQGDIRKKLIAVMGCVLLLAPCWFMLLQAYVVKRYCVYCIASHLAGIVAGTGAIWYASVSISVARSMLIGLMIVSLFALFQVVEAIG